MRLTLRTLLAYLDDILEPSQAKEIGTKIAESDFASSLSNRIREVMRRRRLTAPDLEGPSSGIDPNVVAEYLDNTLSADLVADLEKICLDSDVHLAEVAASHQILTLVLGEPVEISSQSRERMYALAPPKPADEPAAEAEWTGEAAAPAESNGDEAAAKPARPARSFSETIPDYLKPKPMWKRLSPYAIVLVLVVAFFSLVLTDKGLFPNLFNNDSTVANNTTKSGPGDLVAQNQPIKKTLPEATGTTPVASKKPRTNGVTPKKQAGDTRMPPVAGIDKNPPPDAKEKQPPNGAKSPAIVGAVPPMPPAKGKTPKTKTVASKTPKKPARARIPKSKVEPPAVVGTTPALRFNPKISRALLLRENVKAADWRVLMAETSLNANDRVVSPVPFDSLVEVNRGRSRLMLTAGTAVRILPPSVAAAYGFELQKGRMVFRSKTTAMKGEPDERVFSLKVRDEVWRVELLAAGSVCGIEMLPKTVVGFEAELGMDTYSGAIYAQSGSVRVSNAKGDVVVLNGGDSDCGRLSLTPSERMRNGVRRFGPVKQAAAPSWLSPAGRQKSEQVRRLATLYRKKFEDSGSTLVTPSGKGISMRENVMEIVQTRRPLVAEFAMHALASTDSYADLVQAISRTQHEEARKVAVNGLRVWLAANSENRKRLKIALGKTWPRADAEAVYRLLWGFTKTDARNGGTSRDLVDWLGHSEVAIRELAFENIYRLTNRRYGYRALLTKSQRALAMSRWNSHLNKHGALLPPEKSD